MSKTYICTSKLIDETGNVIEYRVKNVDTDEERSMTEYEVLNEVIFYGIIISNLNILCATYETKDKDDDWLQFKDDEPYEDGDDVNFEDEDDPTSKIDMYNSTIEEIGSIPTINPDGLVEYHSESSGELIRVFNNDYDVADISDNIEEVLICGYTDEIREQIEKYRLKANLLGLNIKEKYLSNGVRIIAIDTKAFITNHNTELVLGNCRQLLVNLKLKRLSFENVVTTEYTILKELIQDCEIDELDLTGLDLSKIEELDGILIMCNIGHLKIDTLTDMHLINNTFAGLTVKTLEIGSTELSEINRKHTKGFQLAAIDNLIIRHNTLKTSDYLKIFELAYIRNTNLKKLNHNMFPIDASNALYKGMQILDILKKYIRESKNMDLVTLRTRIKIKGGIYETIGINGIIKTNIFTSKRELAYLARLYNIYSDNIGAVTYSIIHNTFRFYTNTGRVIEANVIETGDKMDKLIGIESNPNKVKVYTKLSLYNLEEKGAFTDNNQLLIAIDKSIVPLDAVFVMGSDVYNQFNEVRAEFKD